MDSGASAGVTRIFVFLIFAPLAVFASVAGALMVSIAAVPGRAFR